MPMTARVASASGGCVAPVVNHTWDGAVGTGAGSVRGADAYITNEQPSLCTPGDGTSGSSAWSMVAGAGQNQYAQAGYLTEPGWSAPKMFTEYNDGTRQDGQTTTTQHWSRKFWVTSPATGIHGNAKFATGIYSSGSINILINDQLVDWTPFNPDTTWTAPFNAQFLGETWDPGDDMPGTKSTPAHFTQWQIWTDQGYLGPPQVLTPKTGAYYYYAFTPSGTSTSYSGVDIWTDRTGGSSVPVNGH
jgi:hypothetical protein